MGFVSVLGFAHQLAAARIRPGDLAIDATAGSGVDTLFLARCVGAGGRVYSIDVQEEALARTRSRLDRELPGAEWVKLHLSSHARLGEIVPGPLHGTAAAVMFNLGYLPGSDQKVITRAESTLPALDAALGMLRSGGIVTAVLYSGHPGGAEEAAAVLDWARSLDPERYQVLRYDFLNQKNYPPYLIAAEKKQSCD
jgi:predicted methyltransferase